MEGQSERTGDTGKPTWQTQKRLRQTDEGQLRPLPTQTENARRNRQLNARPKAKAGKKEVKKGG